MLLLHRVDNIEKELAKNNQMDRIEKQLAKNRGETAELHSQLRAFSDDVLKQLESHACQAREDRSDGGQTF